MNISPNILAKNQIFKNPRHSFVHEKALITTILISSCHWKTFAPFCLRKKRPERNKQRIFNSNTELSQNRTEKQLMLSKTTINWLLNDI